VIAARSGTLGGSVWGSRGGAGTGFRIGSTTIFLSGFPISIAVITSSGRADCQQAGTRVAGRRTRRRTGNPRR
jgi:hypothetical protein